MAKVAPRYEDKFGKSHASPKAAALAELAAILGYSSALDGAMPPLALLILDKRPEIEQTFADYDMMRAYAEQEGA